ncbi:MAG: hypothetical protein NT154_01385, partial [Verrucomicrobia bacterium]|nr:hypothetical protein [Verrucomicrobiota bacterium]
MNPSIPIMQRRDLWSRACCLFLFLLLGLGLSIAPAANLLTNPGFEDGQTGWANPNTLRGGNSIVLSNPAMAHSGNNYVSNYNATGNSSLEQGDSAYGWSTGVSLPVSGANFYRLSAWVKVPGASTN